MFSTVQLLLQYVTIAILLFSTLWLAVGSQPNAVGQETKRYVHDILGKQLEAADIGEAAKRFTLLLQRYSETLEERNQHLLTELEAERRAAEERWVLAEARRVEEEARKRAIEQKRQEYERKVRKDKAEHEAAEYQRLAHEKELVRIASLVEAETADRARQAKEAEQWQAMKEAEARRKAQEARAQALLEQMLPSTAFNLAYSDFRRGKYDLAAAGFQRFVKDYPVSSLTGTAHYWLGESYYQQKDYVRAMQAFEYVSDEYPANEKVPASLFKLGIAAREAGDLVKSKKNFKRLVEEFPSSEEAELARKRLSGLPEEAIMRSDYDWK
jgi:tol-pal system protein YbgF